MGVSLLYRYTVFQAAGARMSRRAAPYTQAEIARVLKAAKQAGASSVEIRVGETTVTVSLDKQLKAPNIDETPVRL